MSEYISIYNAAGERVECEYTAPERMDETWNEMSELCEARYGDYMVLTRHEPRRDGGPHGTDEILRDSRQG